MKKQLIVGMVLIVIFSSTAYAEYVYIPRNVDGYANYEDNVVIIRISPNMELGVYLWLAFHEWAHFQYQELPPRNQSEVKRWYDSLDNYTTNYSQECRNCVRWEEEYAEHYASTWSCMQQ